MKSFYLLLAGFNSIWSQSWCFSLQKAEQRRQRPWVHQRQNQFGEYHYILQEQLDQGRFERYYRLSRTQFEDLLPRVGGQISLRDTNYRSCIPAVHIFYIHSIINIFVPKHMDEDRQNTPDKS
ncbi:hypothetical protein AMECASPLE_026123 [Ameca splendens]|uniref:Uncharacterized protein n=1 Tax=Ameca splendens TaxID=208324 RepID=A0ABV0XU09_9TELE